LRIANLANIKWEGVPDFGGYYPEGSLTELESRSRTNRPNQQYQSTEGTSCTHKQKKIIKNETKTNKR